MDSSKIFRTIRTFRCVRLLGKRLLVKYKKKNSGNIILMRAVDKLVADLEENKISSKEDLYMIRPDADQVHAEGFYFFNLVDHRTMILLEFTEDESTVVWCGDHDSYERTFRNNKQTIRKWLQSKNYIR